MSLTRTLVITISVVSLGAFQYGFHLAELNAPQEVIVCGGIAGDEFVNDCIPMTSSDVGLVNSIYSVGGFLSALAAGPVADRLGRRRASFVNCVFLALGSFLLASAPGVFQMCLGRFLSGIGAGSAIVVCPMYLSEISPPKLRGLIGGMSQILTNTGIFVAQVLGVFLSKDLLWRYILYFGVLMACLNAALLPLGVESPKWLALHGMIPEAKACLIRLRHTTDVDDELSQWKLAAISESSEGEGLLGRGRSGGHSSNKVGIRTFLLDPQYRKPLIACTGIMVAQQFTGVNSIVFYGVSVLKDSLPGLAPLVSCLISLLNLVTTIAISPFIDRYGRKALLLASVAGMTACSAILAIGMVGGYSIISALGASAFVVSFAVGVGPIPFLIISELVPHTAVGVAQSAGTTASWLSTFIIAYFFPTLHQLLGPKVFFLFTFTGSAALLFVNVFIPETHGKTYAQVWSH